MTPQRWESIWLPLAGVVLTIGLFTSTIAAIVTADWRYLIAAVGCFVLLAAE